MNDRRPTVTGIAMRAAMRSMLLSKEHTHWVTLNFHAPTGIKAGRGTLDRWSLKVVDRIFRDRCFTGRPMGELFRFAALPEYSERDHLHWHLVMWVHPNRHRWFEGCAGAIWKRLAITGTSDIQVIRRSAKDSENVVRYATKDFDRPFSYNEFIFSNMLDLPAFGGERSPWT